MYTQESLQLRPYRWIPAGGKVLRVCAVSSICRYLRDEMLRSWRYAYGSWTMATSSIGVGGVKKWVKLDWHRCFPYANGFCCTTFRKDLHEDSDTNQCTDRAETRAAKEIILSDTADYVPPMDIIKNTTHRDGAIRKSNFGLLKLHRIAERDETQLEPMELSEHTDYCHLEQEMCFVHYPSHMLQIFSLKLAQIPIDRKSIELYGYIAVRDCQDSLLNYIVNRSRDDPITVHQGSLIEMTGPKRGISLCCAVLLEFDMRIKKGGKEEDDLQLIDGASEFSELTTPSRPCTGRINGESGAIDITFAHLHRAVEATIEVVISDVHSGFRFSLSSFVFTRGLRKEIQLFHGTIGESCALKRFVIAVSIDTWMHLKFKIGQIVDSKSDVERYCSFKANCHGCDNQHIMVDVALVSAKVVWSTLLC